MSVYLPFNKKLFLIIFLFGYCFWWKNLKRAILENFSFCKTNKIQNIKKSQNLNLKIKIFKPNSKYINQN